MTENQRWYALDVNPEPWAVGPLDLIRRNGKIAPTMGRNQQLAAYQQAVKDELFYKYGATKGTPYAPNYALAFFFWRDTQKGNYADTTNLMKATEDALQDILLTNDRAVIRNYSEIAEQGPDVRGGVIFSIQWGLSKLGTIPGSDLRVPFPTDPPEEILREFSARGRTFDSSDNSWPPK